MIIAGSLGNTWRTLMEVDVELTSQHIEEYIILPVVRQTDEINQINFRNNEYK